jgi:hypothetical protein
LTGERRIAVALLLGAVVLSGCGPWGRTPGFRLFGEVVTSPVDDWSFADEHRTIAVETRTWYGIPHSVTTSCVARAGSLYVPARNPTTKYWVGNVLRDPRVRIRIGDRIYERKAVRETEGWRLDDVREALAAKYGPPREPAHQRAERWYFRMDPRDEG